MEVECFAVSILFPIIKLKFNSFKLHSYSSQSMNHKYNSDPIQLLSTCCEMHVSKMYLSQSPDCVKY